MTGFNTSDSLGFASAATTDGLTPPRYGLAYDLSTGQWTNSAQFQQFVRDVLPATQQKAQAQAKYLQAQSLKAQELERAQNFQEHGLFMTAGELGANKSGIGNQIETGFKALFGIGKQALSQPAREVKDLPGDAYQQYSKAGGLLSEQEFSGFDDSTKKMLLTHAVNHKDLQQYLTAPGVRQGVGALGAIYRGTTTGVEMLPHPTEYTSGDRWAQAWRESQGHSLGNALVNLVLDPFYSQEQLDRWKRDNPWYQMTSFGAELGATWVADPVAIGGKATGGAARFARTEFPINEASPAAIALRQAVRGDSITVRSPLAKGYANVQAYRINNQWGKVEEAAQQMTPAEFAQLPMFKQRYRAQDGGAAAYALHWAANNKAEFATHGIDTFDLTRRLTMGDPSAYAQLRKLQDIAPAELQQIAPGAGSLLNSMDALRTKADVLQRETDDLLREADNIEAGTSTSKALPMFHRWEIHTSLADKQRQLSETTDMLNKYEGYQNWLDLVTGPKGDPILSRVQGPTRARWSQVRNRPDDGATETRSLFMDNQFGAAHSFHRITKPLFLKRANTVEIHSLDSGLMSINRQFDQFEHLFNYAPQGAREDALMRYVKANSAYDRYAVLHNIEEEHLIGGIANKFGIEPDMARAIVHKIHDERNKTIEGILSGDGSVYRSAPTVSDRLASGSDQSLQLVSHDQDLGTFRVKLMNGNHVQEFDIPEAALEKRVAPEDITQTPNYYNPLDTRRLYHELKHDPNMLEELNAGWIHDQRAAAVHTAEWAGTKFNEFWKPVQLFRLGWPMRVLMDEGARATAIFGPMYWLTGPGAESVYTVGRNIIPNVTNYIARKRKGPLGVSMGDGPVARAAKQSPNQIVRDADVADAVQVPQEMWPKINPERLAKIKGHYNAWDDYDRAATRARLWQNGEMGRLLSSNTNLTPAQTRALDYGLNASQFSEARPDNPLFAALRDPRLIQDEEVRHPLVFDAARGKEHKTGYVVPLPDTALNTHAIGNTHRESMTWLDKNSELLSRSGMRLVVNHDGTISVGRHFTSNRFKDAQQFAQYVAEKHPDVQMWNLGKKKSFFVQDANDLSPISEQSYRYFVNEEKKAFTPGEAPVEGKPAVYHGTDRDLPSDLLPRHEAPFDNGRMIGEGLYTTTSRDIAESYGSRNLYTIRGAKSGRQYKVWDLDQPITPHQIEDLDDWLRTHADRFNLDDENILRIMQVADEANRLAYVTVRGEKPTWANLYEGITEIAWMGQDKFHKALHAYLEERHGVGALTHTGGTTHGHPHQVYVWLHPHDLVVKPAYAGTGEYHSLPEWFSHPLSVENVVPENRIIRMGLRNPMLRELRQIDAQIQDMGKSLTAAGRGKLANPEFRALVVREQELMNALGLDYKGREFSISSTEPNRTLLPERYTVADPGHFNRMVEEARTEDEARTLRAAANGDLRAQEQAVLMQPSLNFDNFDMQIDSPTDWLFGKMRERREQGAGWKKIKSADGKATIVPAAFEGHQGQLFRGLTASNGALDVLSEGHGQGTSLFRRKAAAYRTYNPPKFDEKAVKDPRSAEGMKAVRYFQVYADTINDHLGSSPIIQKMIAGWHEDKIIDWLDNSIEGQRILRDVKPKEMPTGVWVDDHRFKLDYYVPSKKLQRLLGKGRLQPSDFRKNIADEDLPTIYGPDLEVLDRRRGAGRFLSDWADKAWEYLGNKPIDSFSRHPFAQAMYQRKMKNLIASTDSKWLTPDMIERYQNQAHTFALNETRRMLYNLTETTNFNDALRFIAPFWGAQYEAISKWLRIISDRPETVGRFFAAQRSVYKNFVVVDPNNNHQEVTSGTRPGGMHGLGLYHPNDMVIMQMPKFIQKKFGLQGIGSVGIPIGSANTVLQGDLPLLPSLGPIVTIPADQFMRKVSATYGVEHDQSLLYRWMFPIGRPRSKDTINQMLDQFVPGWVNRYRQASGPEDSLSRINMEMLIGREMTLRNRKLGKADPTPAEIEKAANHLWHVRIVSGLIQPFQTQFLPDHQYWIDAAHQFQKQYGQQWWDKFIDKYGEEAAIYATSSSNSIGVPPTDKGMEEWKQNKDLIAKYPNWTSAIISPQAYMGQFSSDAYGQQFNITLGPGDTRTLRSGSSLQDRLFNDPEVQLGWREYRKINAGIEAELHARGLTSIQQKGAEQLALLKQAAKAQIAQKYPAWARAFQAQSTTINADVSELQKLAPNPMFDNRPDWQGVRQYLIIRQKATDILDALGKSGGSRSLQASQNAPLAQWFYGQVGQLVLDNPAFAEFYSRYLDQDTLTMGSGF